MAGSLLESSDGSEWEARLEKYPEALAVLSSLKSKGKDELLKSLDTWYHGHLSNTIKSRPQKHITREELCKLMKWKLARGKFRPRLEALVASNSDEAVVSASTAAFESLPDLEAAVNSLTVLKGVGPATASGVLAAGAPELCPFYADEAVQMVPGLQQGVYTLKSYTSFVNAIHAVQQKLNEPGHCRRVFTAHDVELALWTEHFTKHKQHYATSETGRKKKAAITTNGPKDSSKKSRKD